MQNNCRIHTFNEQKMTTEENNVKRKELIQHIQSVIHDLEADLQRVASSISKNLIEKALIQQKRQLHVALTCENVADIQRQIKFYQLNRA